MAMVLTVVSLSSFAQEGGGGVTAVAKIEETGYTSLADAITAAESAETDEKSTIVLLADLTITEAVTINKKVIIDFSGHTITGSLTEDAFLITIQNSGTLQLSDNSLSTAETEAGAYSLGGIKYNSEKKGIFYNKGMLEINGGIFSDTDSGKEKLYSIAYCDPGVAENAEGAEAPKSTTNVLGGSFNAKYCFVVKKASTFGMSGGEIIAKWFGISGNGNTGEGGTNITMSGGKISSEETGIYHPQNGKLTISGGEISGGWSAVEVRSGETVITGGTLTSTSKEYSCNPNSNGNTTKGAAIAIVQHITKNTISVNLSGGNFEGVKAITEENPQQNDPAPQIQMAVTGGTYKGDIYTTDVKNFISGGVFSEEVSEEYCAANYAPDKNSDGSYEVLFTYILNDEDAYTKPEIPAESKWKAVYTRTSGMSIGDAGTRYGTLCLPFSIAGAQEGITFYTPKSITDGTLTIIPVSTQTEGGIVAGTPLIFELQTAAESITVSSRNAVFATSGVPTEGQQSPATLFFNGVFTKKEINAGETSGDVYFLRGDSFYKADLSSSILTVPAYRAYISLPQSSNSKELKICKEEETTAVTELFTNDLHHSAIYNLSGNRQNGLQKGMNIVALNNGKTVKVFVK